MKTWLYCEYPVSVTWSDHSNGDHKCAWLLITTAVVDDFFMDREGCDSWEVYVEQSIGFGSAASGINIEASFRTEINPHDLMIRDVDK